MSFAHGTGPRPTHRGSLIGNDRPCRFRVVLDAPRLQKEGLSSVLGAGFAFSVLFDFNRNWSFHHLWPVQRACARVYARGYSSLNWGPFLGPQYSTAPL